MPFIIRNRHDRASVQLAHASAMSSTGEIVEQLQAQVRQLQDQLKAEREQSAFNSAHYEEQISTLLRDLLQAKYEIAKRDREAAFAAAPSPSAMGEIFAFAFCMKFRAEALILKSEPRSHSTSRVRCHDL